MAQYYTDFSEFDTGAGTPAGMTVREGSLASTEIAAAGGYTGGKAWLFDPSIGDCVVSVRDALSATTEMDMVVHGEFSTNAADANLGIGQWEASAIWYRFARHPSVSGDRRLAKLDGGFTVLGDYSVAQTVDTRYFARFRRTATRTQAKWATTLAGVTGEPPPGGWDVDVAEDGLDVGRPVMISNTVASVQTIDELWIGTAGDLAIPSGPPPTAVNSISWTGFA